MDPDPAEIDTRAIRTRMPVVCSHRGQFAIVDAVEGKSVRLLRDVSGLHHYIPLSWITAIDDKVHVDRPGKEAMREWFDRPVDEAAAR
jgi:hypothetical protein